MTALAAAPSRTPALPRLIGPIRPRPRWVELRLLLLVALAIAVGSVSLNATVNGSFRLYDVQGIVVYVAGLCGLAAAAALVRVGRSSRLVATGLGVLAVTVLAAVLQQP